MFLADAEKIGEFLDALDHFFPRRRADAVGSREEIQIFMDGDVAMPRQRVGDVTDEAMSLVRFLDDGDVVEKDIAAAGFVERGDDAHGGAFAGAVGSDEADDFAGREGKRDVVHRPRAAIVLFQMVDVNVHRFPRTEPPRITRITRINPSLKRKRRGVLRLRFRLGLFSKSHDERVNLAFLGTAQRGLQKR